MPRAKSANVPAASKWGLLVLLVSLLVVGSSCKSRTADPEMKGVVAADGDPSEDQRSETLPADDTRSDTTPAEGAPADGMRPDVTPSDATPSDATPSDVAQATDSDPLPDGSDEPPAWQDWPVPAVALAITGNQYGYIEPCGCTGLENQKGGLARRMTFFEQVQEAGWPLLPIDAGNQVRRFGRQPEIKFQSTISALEQLGYQAVGFGPDDLRLGVGELVAVAASDDPQQGLFVSSNVTLIDPSLIAQAKVITSGDHRIGVTAALDPATVQADVGDEIEVADPTDAIRAALESLNQQQADFRVLMYFGTEQAAMNRVREVPGFNLLVVASGFGEPYYQPQRIPESETLMVVTGNKGMYASLVGIYPDEPFRYARVAMTHEFGDAPAMRQLMANYQQQLEALGLEGLGLRPVGHPSGDRFVGSKVCGECHTTAYAIWEGTPHHHATLSIVEPPNDRGDVPRHFDPECLSCHVTGWHPQNFYPYDSGFLSLESGAHLTGNGCENCHGPGEKHVNAERNRDDYTEDAITLLRQAMQLPLEKARDTCLECHDLDNSPDFHQEGAFERYWEEVEHYGLD